MEFWSWNPRFELFFFWKTKDLSLKFGHWECEIENLGMKIWILKYTWKLSTRNFFFFWGWLSQLNLTPLTQLWLNLSVWGPKFHPPPHTSVSPSFLFCFIFINFSSSIGTIHLLLPLDFSSSSHHFFSQKTLF